LRRTKDENIVLHAWNTDSDAHRSYRVDRIQGARMTNRVFKPRYAVELTPSGPVVIPPTERSASSGASAYGGFATPRAPRRTTRRSAFGSSYSSGPTYIYQCGMCGKKFRHKKMNGKLNKHKNTYGMQCSGRTGSLVDTKY
jgi:hypothetical protein